VGITRGSDDTWWYSRRLVSTSIVYLKFIYSPVTSSLSAENTIKDQLSSWGKRSHDAIDNDSESISQTICSAAMLKLPVPGTQYVVKLTP
jgi:hypothetical protein